MEMIYCCKLLVVQSSSTLHSLLVSSFRQMYHVAAFSSCKVSVYLVRKNQPPCNIQCIVFPTVNSDTVTQESSSHGTCKLQRHTCTLCGRLLLFKTERVSSSIQQTCFCQLWVISTNY